MPTSDSQQTPATTAVLSTIPAQPQARSAQETAVIGEAVPAASPPSPTVDALAASAIPVLGTNESAWSKPPVLAEPGPTSVATAGTDPGKAATLYLTKVQILVALLVLITPVVYFNGSAFHEGWYEYFRLDPAMFPLDTPGTLTWGTVAWADLLLKIVTTLKQVELSRWLLPMSLVGGGAVTGSLMAWGHDSWKLSRAKRGNQPTSESLKKFRLVAIRLVLPIVAMVLFAVAIYALIFAVMLVLAIMSGPFYALGVEAAQKAALNGFPDRPVVIVTTQTRAVEQREIACGP